MMRSRALVQLVSHVARARRCLQAMPGLESADRFDLVVIGSGPAGQKCAINAAKKRKRVAIIDRGGMMGGVCVHTGTIPSKTFREAVLYLTGYRQRGFYGRDHVERETIHSQDILDRVKKVEGWETEIVLNQLQRNGVTVLRGRAEFVDPHHIRVEHDEKAVDAIGGVLAETSVHVNALIRFDNALIATGTFPARSPLYPFDGQYVFDSDSILRVRDWRLPKSMIVVGGGVIALEYASMFNALPGTRVTIIDRARDPLAFVDRDVLDVLRDSMRSAGATFRMNEVVTGVEVKSGRVLVTLDSKKVVKADALLYAVGRQGNTSKLKLEACGVETNDRGLIEVNKFYQTKVDHIYAAGDVIGFPALASVSMEQGRIASNHMFKIEQGGHPDIFPYGIYTIPEISMVGKSERDLTEQKIAYETGVAKFDELAKGQMLGLKHGFLKIIFCPNTKKLLGVHAIGENATEIIHIGQVLVTMGGSVEYFREHVFNFPTFAEAYRVAALDGLGKL